MFSILQPPRNKTRKKHDQYKAKKENLKPTPMQNIDTPHPLGSYR